MSSTNDTGTLYVLSNADRSLAKIGLTRHATPICRADAYAREHGIQWHVYWYALTCNVAAAEAHAHRELQDHPLVPGAREIFHVTPQYARCVAERYVVAPEQAAEVARQSIGAACREAVIAAALLGLVCAFGGARRGAERAVQNS